MSNGIQPLGCQQGGEPAMPAGTGGNTRPSPDFAPAAPGPAQAPWTPNPSLCIDPALGIVILEFHDRPGAVTSTIPTARQIDDYRRASGQSLTTPARSLAEAGTIKQVTTNDAAATPPSPRGDAVLPAKDRVIA